MIKLISRSNTKSHLTLRESTSVTIRANKNRMA